jgi:hypothetical protein
MRNDVQRMPKSRDQSERKTYTTQHDRIDKKYCVCLTEKEKSSRPDVVHTRPEGMLSDKRSTEPRTSGRKNMSVRTLHTRS